MRHLHAGTVARRPRHIHLHKTPRLRIDVAVRHTRTTFLRYVHRRDRRRSVGCERAIAGQTSDVAVRALSIVGVSMPAFFLGLILQIIFFRNLELLPLAGRVDADLRFTAPLTKITDFILLDSFLTSNWVTLKDAFLHLILPAVTLAAYPTGLIARMTRAAMLETLEQDYIRTAKAYGIKQHIIIYLYALKNAISPTLTVLGLTFAFALTGTFFVEIIFNWPGLGLFTVRSLLSLDYPAIMGMTLFGASGYVLINLIVDVLQAWVDPRISLK
ncbi:MAG: ABC transporter permease [Anaerolineales bacterium]